MPSFVLSYWMKILDWPPVGQWWQKRWFEKDAQFYLMYF